MSTQPPDRTMYTPSTTELWDRPVRGEQYSIVTKRRRLSEFVDDPTEASLKRLARSMWAFESWPAVDFPVEERLLKEGHSPPEFRDLLQGIHDGTQSTSNDGEPDLATFVVSEFMEAWDPDTYATLNWDARQGMEALGYETPGRPMESGDAYWQFVENVQESVSRYDLRDLVTASAIDEIPGTVPEVDVAQVAFQMHADDDIDLSTVTEPN